jgi:hypothetical protein
MKKSTPSTRKHTEKVFKSIEKTKLESFCRSLPSAQAILRALGVDMQDMEAFVKKEYDLDSLGELMDMKKGEVQAQLFNKMYEVAMEGNPMMLKFLAKNLMGYSDNVDTSIQLTQNNANIQFNIVPSSQMVDIPKIDEIEPDDDLATT